MPKTSRPAVHPRRRTLLRWSLLPASGAVGWPGLAGAADTPNSADRAEPPRLALLIGNRAYPGGEDLPPIHKNVRDLNAALQKRGFTVTDGLDLDLPAARSLVARFVASVKAAPADAIVFFYFSGHGAQVDAENLLVSSQVNPSWASTTSVPPTARRPVGPTVTAAARAGCNTPPRWATVSPATICRCTTGVSSSRNWRPSTGPVRAPWATRRRRRWTTAASEAVHGETPAGPAASAP